MKAVVMAGGEGTRLRPLTSNQPKPMVPILNKPVMAYILELLREHGFDDVVVTLQFLPQMIKNYFGRGTDFGLYLNYSIEEQPLGTAGSVKNAERHLRETFLVISGDALTDFDLSYLVEFHRRKGALATIALKRVENPLEFGVVITEDTGQIERFLEKPTWGQVFSDTVNTGIYVLEPEIFDYIPEGEAVDFSQDLFPLLLKEGKPLYGCIMEGYWCDIGNFEQYVKAHQDLLDLKSKIQPPGIKMKENVWVGDGAYIDPSVDITGPVAVGQYAKVEPGAELREYSVIGNNVVVRNSGHIHRSIIWDNAYVGPQAHIHGAVVGKNCDIKSGARLLPGVVVGDESVVGEGAVINHDVKIYPFKRVDAGAVINTSLIWESRGMRTLFGKSGVSGLINIDITADLALRLALAFGTTHNKDSTIVLSQDASRAARMLKRAVAAGLNATGINCEDLRIASAAINRFMIKTGQAVGGIHIRTSPFDPQSIELQFFDGQGIDISESTQRNIEKYYYREDFRRVYFNEIGEIIFPPRTVEAYRSALLRLVNVDLIRKANLKLVIDYAHGSASLIMPHLLNKLGCDVIAVNTYASEDRTTLSQEELDMAMGSLAKTVEAFKADLGVLIDSGGEKIFLVDEKGSTVTVDEALHLFVKFVCQFERRKGKIAVPLTVSKVVESIAGEYGRKVIRTKVSTRSLMEAALKGDVAFAGAQGGGYIFPQFLPSYDGIASLFKLFEYLVMSKKSLSALVAELPDFHLAQKNAFCPWDLKGTVMRRLMELAKDKDVELIDGVKIYDTERWALVIPDPEEPIVRVYAEGKSAHQAEQEAENYVKFVSDIVSSAE
jgi:mannose-1-phosphate guanylyltransferase/phosphomannomutase